MAKVLKYRLDFKGFDGASCQVEFYYEGYSGAVTYLDGADRPFVLKEFNTDEDLFKPIRPMMAEINILASSTGVKIEDFLAETDTDIEVRFYSSDFPTAYIFIGILLQDNFQETWVDTNHIITLAASDRFGYLKEVQLTNFGSEFTGRNTPLEYIEAACDETYASFAQFSVINNLFHTSMTSTNGNHPLDQCKIDAKTFQIQAQTYDSCYNVLEKINRAFNQTLFLYMSKPFLLRLEEFYIPSTQNLRGVYINNLTFPATKTLIDTRYDINVGVNEEVKPITPEMLRFIKRKTKKDTVQFDFTQFDEIFCNQTFERGSLVSSTSTLKTFNVSNWTWYEGALGSPTTPTTGAFYRAETYVASGSITDNYIYITQDSSQNRWIKSCGVNVVEGETFSFSVDHRYKVQFSGFSTRTVMVFQLISGANYYTMDETGTWYASNSSWTTNLKQVEVSFDGSNPVLSNEWNTVEVGSKPIPGTGTLYVSLWCPNAGYTSGQEAWYKNIQIEYNTNFNGFIDKNIIGIQSIFTKSIDVKNNFQQETFIDDSSSKLYRGSIFQTDGTTLTDQNWFRYRYNSERYGFRKQNDIAYWENNRNNRNKIDAYFYGLKWDDNSTTKFIGLMNTIKFVDDDTNRVYAILNLKEIDFASNTWNATLLEVYDNIKDADSSQTFEADFTTGTYSTSPKTIPLTLITAGGFSIVTSDTARYDGATTINTPIDCSIFGTASAASYPSTITAKIEKNGTALKTINYPIYIANQAFTFNLSVGSQSIATNDTIKVVFSGHSSITINGGDIKINTPASVQTFDTYEDKYIYK